jgi:predicted flap endonuclease-1-like 5' DNA nuclease
MLEIALEITLCLLIAAAIGFILGFIVAKSTNKKTDTKKSDDKKPSKKKSEKKKPKTKEKAPIVEKSIEDEIEILLDTVSEEPTKEAKKPLKELDTPENEETQQPELLKAPKNNNKDALTQIKGIGPKVEEQLNKAGIYHFEQIANWSESNIQWLETNTTFAHRAKKDLWINQAKSLI